RRHTRCYRDWSSDVCSSDLSAVWHALAWALFGAAYVGAVVFVASVLAASPGDVLLVLAAGSRLSAYIGGTVGEIGFLRGIWLEEIGRASCRERVEERGEGVG